MKKIGIIGAMEIEVSSLQKKLSSVSVSNLGQLVFYEGELFGVNVVIVKCGVGKVNAALCAQALILKFGVTHIINTGIAGAAATGASVFDIVISRDAVYHDMDATGFGYAPMEIPQMKKAEFVADKNLIEVAEKAFGETLSEKRKLFIGRVASGDQFISEKNKKQEIIKKAQPFCVEMEGAAIAHTCFLYDVPFVIIRSMSDTADESAVSVTAWTETMSAEECAMLVAKTVELFGKN